MKRLGLKQRLERATSADEVKSLIREGDGYDMASPDTKRKWQKVAKRKLEALEAQ